MFDALDKAINKDWLLLLARSLIMVLFVLFGWEKLIAFDATESSFASLAVPLPKLATCIAIGVELGFGTAIVVGFLTRPLALLLAAYTFVISFIGHPYWTLCGADYTDTEINFYKNICIVGGFLLLYLTGGGKYAVDELCRRNRKAD
jgi:putative oxidoreductase